MKLAHSLTVTAVSPQGSDAILLSLGVDGGQRQHFSFQSGQYLTLAVPVQGDEHWRCYSITSAPEDGQAISVLVRRVAGGRVSNWLCDHARAGQRLQVLPPAGRFTLARHGQPVLLYAGGSGIAPIFALAREALLQGAPQVRLFYACRDRATAMLLAELQALQAGSGQRLEIRHWYDAEQGLPTQALLEAQTQGLEAADAYLCGPEAFMHSVLAALAAAGIEPSRVYREDFGAALEGAVETGAEGPDAELTVQLKGQTHTVSVRGGQFLLGAMLDARAGRPHACRVGECASCMCRLVDGEVLRLDSSVLDEDDAAEGWLLACRTRAASAQVRLRFS
uniref:Aniline dioxygenase reductase n=1 Tax=Pseudomonas sp. K82 TaxID=251433 RepID=Q6TFJ0_9PSED|nr:aniline dioxygenase reductase [Pseudomonas sp. K82]